MKNSPNKILLIIIVVLVLTNIAVLAYFLWYKTPAHAVSRSSDRERNGIADVLQKEVGFNDDQVAKYKVLKERQKAIIRPMYDDMRKSKDSLFRLLSAPAVTDSMIDRATSVIAQKQKMLDLETFQHFKRVRALCLPGQEVKYDSMVIRMFRRMGKPRSEQEKTEKKN